MRGSVKPSASVFCFILVDLLVSAGSIQAQPFVDGTGEMGDPYQIATAEQLAAIGSDPNLLDKCYILVADIDLDPNQPGGDVFEEAVIAPDILDANGLDTPGTPFTGSFNGRDHMIRNLTITAPGRDTVGLFGRIGVRDAGKWAKPAVVRNVHLEAVIVTGYERVGALAGVNEGTILNCSASGTITGQRDFIAGLVGYNAGTIAMCRAEGEIRGHDFVAGLLGDNPNGSITQSSFDGLVVGSEMIAGLVGRNSGHVATCSASGTVKAGDDAGGLVAWNGGSVVRSHSTSDVSGGETIGGFVASNSGIIAESYATGNIEGSDNVGGLVGYNHGFIAQCYACGDMLCQETSGGLVGYNSGSITACYATGRVQATDDEGIGGLIGSYGRAASTDDSFWDVETTGQTLSNGGTGLSTAELQTAQTYLDAGWDFVGTWLICEGTDYPRLQWEQRYRDNNN